MKYLTYQEPREYYLAYAGQIRSSMGTGLHILSESPTCPVALQLPLKEFALEMVKGNLDEKELERVFEIARQNVIPVENTYSTIASAVMMILDGLRELAPTSHMRKKIPYNRVANLPPLGVPIGKDGDK